MSRFSGPGPHYEDVDGWTPRTRLRVVKRREAEARDAKTPLHRRRAYRRQFEQATARLEAKPASLRAKKTRARKEG